MPKLIVEYHESVSVSKVLVGQPLQENASQPWFEDNGIAKLVQLAVVEHLTVSMAVSKFAKRLPKFTKKEITEAVEMYNDWRGEVAVKVRRAIEISSSTGLGRGSGY